MCVECGVVTQNYLLALVTTQHVGITVRGNTNYKLKEEGRGGTKISRERSEL